jgi:hypothetical protein
MRARSSLGVRTTLLSLAAVLLLTGEAAAYAGPVPAPEFIGYFLSFLAWLAFMFSALLMWPVYALRRWWRGDAAAEEAPAPDAAPDPAVEPARTEA